MEVQQVFDIEENMVFALHQKAEAQLVDYPDEPPIEVLILLIQLVVSSHL